MKDGFIFKQKLSHSEELQLINKYTRRELSADGVYTFSVVLCDNEIDRDNEQFTRDSLQKMAELFVGKTGICDHNPKSANQSARIFSCCIEDFPEQTTQAGQQYCRLLARAYTVRSAKNEQFILDIDSGIKKEVSVGVSVEKAICSICGQNVRTSPCHHTPGKKYKGKLCFLTLEDPSDAYEWSFVAVPAQKKAGIIKDAVGSKNEGIEIKNQGPGHKSTKIQKEPKQKALDFTRAHTSNVSDGISNSIKGGEYEETQPLPLVKSSAKKSIHQIKGDIPMETLIQNLAQQEETLLTKRHSRKLFDYISDLKEKSLIGEQYRQSLECEVVRLCTLTGRDISHSVMQGLAKKMNIDELLCFKQAFEKRLHESIIPTPQLFCESTQSPDTQNAQFKI